MDSIKVKSFEDFKKKLMTDNKLQQEFKIDPVKTIKEIKTREYPNLVYKIAVISLSASIILIILGIFILYGVGKITKDDEIPTLITAIGSAAIGALAGLLTPPGNSYGK